MYGVFLYTICVSDISPGSKNLISSSISPESSERHGSLPAPPIANASSNLQKRTKKDGYTPHPPPLHWVVGGDSYTAGPGAGGFFDPDNEYSSTACKQFDGSWAAQWYDDFPYDGSDAFQFLACTGYTTRMYLTSSFRKSTTIPNVILRY